MMLASSLQCQPDSGVHQRFFHRNSNSMEILFYPHPSYNEMISMKFYTWHDSCAVMACVKFCSDMMNYDEVTVNPISHQI